jgi:uncharacterized protein (TIGR02444 family)
LSIWPRVTGAYAQPAVERLCLALQDEDGQSASYLLWALWAGEQGAVVDAGLAGRAAALALEWEANVLRPLRAARRALKGIAAVDAQARDAARARVSAEEVASERLLLEALAAMTPQPNTPGDPLAALHAAAGAWDPPAPGSRLAELARAFSASGAFARIAAEMSSSDGPPLANDEAIQARIAELRQAHQDLDDAVQALSAKAVPDQLQIARMKKQKLALRDQITRLEDRLTPDIIA